MDVTLHVGTPAEVATSLLVVGLPESEVLEASVLKAVDDPIRGTLDRAATTGDFRGKSRDQLLIYGGEGSGIQRLLLLGLGAGAELSVEGVRRFVGRAVRAAEGLGIQDLALIVPAVPEAAFADVVQAASEAAHLAAWRFTELKTTGESPDAPTDVTHVLLVVPRRSESTARRGLGIGVAVGRGENLARTLQSRPGNIATPTHLAEQAVEAGKASGFAVRVLGPKEILRERMFALLAVAQGTDEEPRLIVMRYKGAGGKTPPVVLVGKGLTFDAGGISIKPAAGMQDMKYDMSGGAAVIGAMAAIAEAKLPIDVVGIVPSSENLISGSAVKPGDVIRSRAGKTIEVNNTDAEGRLILADALAYGADLRPAPVAMVDCATLTGACVIALGHHASAVLGTDAGVVDGLIAAGERSGERCWQLPLWDEYRRQLDSPVADLVNVGGRPGGTITAACFLREFVGDVPWAHIDIAGTAHGEGSLPYQRKGALGVPTRLLFEWVRSLA